MWIPSRIAKCAQVLAENETNLAEKGGFRMLLLWHFDTERSLRNPGVMFIYNLKPN
jgi:hypothetical protein